jgi:hypothetical protein
MVYLKKREAKKIRRWEKDGSWEDRKLGKW